MAEHKNELGDRCAQIRQEIARTRLRIDGRLDVLEARLAPREVALDAWAAARKRSSNGASRAWETVRSHPLPATAIAAGIGWLVSELRSRGRDGRGAAGFSVPSARIPSTPRRIERPIAIGLAALAAGLVAGLSAPSTRWEDEWVGETHDRFLKAAQSAARDVLDEGRRMAEAAVDAARSEAEHSLR